MNARDLALEVLHVLKLQRDYFRDRKPSQLNESKDAERRLEARCREIVNPTTSLFGGTDDSQ